MQHFSDQIKSIFKAEFLEQVADKLCMEVETELIFRWLELPFVWSFSNEMYCTFQSLNVNSVI